MINISTEKLYEEILEVKDTVIKHIARFEERCHNHKDNTLSIKKGFEDTLERMQTVEKKVEIINEHVHDMLNIIKTNAESMNLLAKNISLLQEKVNNLETSANDREVRLRNIEKYRWYFMGISVAVIFITQQLYKFIYK